MAFFLNSGWRIVAGSRLTGQYAGYSDGMRCFTIHEGWTIVSLSLIIPGFGLAFHATPEFVAAYGYGNWISMEAGLGMVGALIVFAAAGLSLMGGRTTTFDFSTRRVVYRGLGHGSPQRLNVSFDEVTAITYNRWRDIAEGIQITVGLTVGDVSVCLTQHVSLDRSDVALLAHSVGCDLISNDNQS